MVIDLFNISTVVNELKDNFSTPLLSALRQLPHGVRNDLGGFGGYPEVRREHDFMLSRNYHICIMLAIRKRVSCQFVLFQLTVELLRSLQIARASQLTFIMSGIMLMIESGTTPEAPMRVGDTIPAKGCLSRVLMTAMYMAKKRSLGLVGNAPQRHAASNSAWSGWSPLPFAVPAEWSEEILRRAVTSCNLPDDLKRCSDSSCMVAWGFFAAWAVMVGPPGLQSSMIASDSIVNVDEKLWSEFEKSARLSFL